MTNDNWLLLFENTIKNRIVENKDKSAEEIDALGLEVLKKAIKAGYDINYQDGNDYTVLAFAAEYNCIECVKYLLQQNGIDTSLYVGESDDSISGPAIHIAAFKGHLEVIRALLDKSPQDIELVEECGYTPLHETVLGEQYHAFKLLLQRGADEEALTENARNRVMPAGINVFQLIVRGAKDSLDSVFNDMLEYLVLHKNAKDEDVIGNVPDTSDEEDDDKEDDEDEIAEFYRQEEEHDNENPWFYSAETVLHKAKDASLKRSYIDAEIEYELDKKDGYADNAFDTDSEEELDHKPKKIKFNPNFQAFPSGTQLVISARGEHFPRKSVTQAERRNYIERSNNNTLADRNIYSANTHQHAGVDFTLPEATDLARDEKLKEADKETKKLIEKLEKEKNVAPVLQVSGAGSRALYDNRLVEMIQRYVNSYHTFSSDAAEAQNTNSNSRRTDRTKLKQKIYQEVKANPFISTSEDIKVGLQYAFAILNYDKKETHRPASEKMHNITLMPRYRRNGELHHPYLGVIFIILHQQQAINENSAIVLDLFS